MATMTMLEAEHIIEIVSVALEDTSHRYHPISALQGYDIAQIYTAAKLKLANEFLLLAHRGDFDEQFAEGGKVYDSLPYRIMRFVPDDEIDSIFPKGELPVFDPSTYTLKDKRWRLALEETVSSFGQYCKSVGSEDSLYWQKIYTHLGLKYTSKSPKGNYPVYND